MDTGFAWVKYSNPNKRPQFPEPSSETAAACPVIIATDGGRPPPHWVKHNAATCRDPILQIQRLAQNVPSSEPDFAVDPVYSGLLSQPGRFSVVRVLGDRAQAIDWLVSPQGKAWRSDALSYFLISTGPQQLVSLNAPTLDAVPATGEPRFPANEWGLNFQHWLQQGSQLSAPTKAALQAAVPDRGAVDVADVRQAMAQWPAKQGAIRHQADDMRSAVAVLAPLGDFADVLKVKPVTLEVLRALIDAIRPSLFFLKGRYSRGRPIHLDPTLQPGIRRGEDFYPAHASYPAGHATHAWVVAQLFSDVFPTFRADFEANANEVAQNRVVAGVHFPQDLAAGVALANHLKGQPAISTIVQSKSQALLAEWS